MHEIDTAPVDALLSAVDQVMNSNTLLLRVRADAPITDAGRQGVLEGFVRGPLFAETMRSADVARGWGNLQSGRLSVGDAALDLTELTENEFRARLLWMLCESFSPYRRHLDSARAAAVVSDFVQWLHWSGSARGELEGWSYWSVRPDFLPATGYYGQGSPQSDAVYFDGGPNDTATYLYRGDVLMVLLTNGCP